MSPIRHRLLEILPSLWILLAILVAGPAAAQTSDGPTFWAAGQHPESAFGKGQCTNLSASDPVNACYRHCQSQDCDFFWVYTDGANAGRCCPKSWSMYAPEQGMRALSGGSSFFVKPKKEWATGRGPKLWAVKKHPESAFGKGSCVNLDAGRAVDACYEKCAQDGCDFFWVYTEGASAGRCCPKTWAMFDASRGFRDLDGGASFWVASSPLVTRLQPLEDARCLGRVSGGFTLVTCGADTNPAFSGKGTIAFGNECVAVPVPEGVEADPWRDGTRLKATRCDHPEAAETRWLLDGKVLRAASRPDKCLSMRSEGGPGAMTAIILDCGSSDLTTWLRR